MDKVLITGGLGNLGSWLTEYFVNAGKEVWVLSKNFRQVNTKVKYHLLHCDIAELSECKDKLSGLSFDFVIHAASVNEGFIPGYAHLALQVNTLGTRNLLEVLKDSDIKNFIYLSTFQVYGQYEGNIEEDTLVAPKSDYGSTHLFGEYYVKQFWYSNKLPHTIIRLTNSYGCPKDYNSSKWYLILNDLSKMAFENKEIVLKSNGNAARDFIWMEDVCKVLLALCSVDASNETYNLSGEQTFKMIDIARFVKQAYFERYNIEIPININMDDKTTYKDNLYVSSQKLKKLIPYETQPHFTEESLRIFEFLEKRL